MLNRKFQISDPVWWGFNREINLEEFNSVKDVVNHFLELCEKFLKENNLLEQYDKFKLVKPRFHIHGCNNEDELTDYDLLINTNHDQVIYVCRHEASTKLDNIFTK